MHRWFYCACKNVEKAYEVDCKAGCMQYEGVILTQTENDLHVESIKSTIGYICISV
jgi:hypothetical protein